MVDRACGAIRSLVERLGGEMVYEREGYRHGAWVIRVGEASVVIEAGGSRSFPELDGLQVPRVAERRTWDDYTPELLPDAEVRLWSLLLGPGRGQALAAAVEHARWKFAWTYARTYPHEYTTRKTCGDKDHAVLIDCIERGGVREPFAKTWRKYLHFAGRRYWHMGDPHSEDPAKLPNVINRAWVDVRRHAENVRHVWTPREVELQQEIWEICRDRAAGKPLGAPPAA